MSAIRLLHESQLEDRNQLYYEPPSIHGEEDSQEFLIFMITGNPGFISFYEPFLSTLNILLSSSASRFYISGYSLAGFHASEGDFRGASSSPIGLKGQVDYIEKKLFKQVNALRRSTGSRHTCPKVILMGHSVGAYILLELIRQHRMRVIDEGEEDFDLIGGILLFPTITHIAQSPQGMIYSVSFSFFLSFFFFPFLSRAHAFYGGIYLTSIENPSISSFPFYCWRNHQIPVLLDPNSIHLRFSKGGNAVSGACSQNHCLPHQESSGYPTSTVSALSSTH